MASGASALEYRFVRPGLRDVDPGFADRRRTGNPAPCATAALSPGDPLETPIMDRRRRESRGRAGTAVGRLAR